jgi:tetratricopeptide (TPR) repeat protein
VTGDRHEHPSDEVLFHYAEGGASYEDRADVEAHLANCSACVTAVTTYRTLGGAMAEEETWHLTDEMVGQNAQQRLREIAVRRQVEDAEAERLLRGKLGSAYQFAYANIPRRKRCYTGGVVRLLCQTAWDQLDRDARFAKMLAEAASVIAEALPADYYPSQAVEDLRGTAWLYYASACGSLGVFKDGEEALKRADRAFARLPDGGTQIGRVELSRAVLLAMQQRHDQALRWARSAAMRFEARGETKRYFEAKECEAGILMRLGQPEVARQMYLTTCRVADSLGEPEAKARAVTNLAISCREVGDLDAASKYFAEALQWYEALDMSSMVVHTRWSIATLAVWAGDAAEACLRFPSIIRELESRGMLLDSAYARLDYVEALLRLGRPEAAHEESSTLVEFFSKAEILTGALTALAFMKEASAHRALTVLQVRAIQKYVRALADSPTLLFSPETEESG